LETSVYLPDGATMWIGGIVRDDMTETKTGIPLLSDIPVVGWIFGRRQNSNIKTTLFFFCTPRIMDDDKFAELADVSQSGKNRAAEVIGLDRVKRIDPGYRMDGPLDVILEEDIDGDGLPESGLLDLSGFAAPVLTAPSGEMPIGDLRQATGLRDSGALEFTAEEPVLLETPGRSLPEGR
jgi:hypothetical protein